MTDGGDKMCCRQLLDVGQGIGRSRHQHPPFSHKCRGPTCQRCHEYQNSVQRTPPQICQETSKLSIWKYYFIKSKTTNRIFNDTCAIKVTFVVVHNNHARFCLIFESKYLRRPLYFSLFKILKI